MDADKTSGLGYAKAEQFRNRAGTREEEQLKVKEGGRLMLNSNNNLNVINSCIVFPLDNNFEYSNLK